MDQVPALNRARYPQHPWIWQLKGLVARGRLA